MRILVAVGGNALLQRGEPMESDRQIKSAFAAGESMARIAADNELVLVHGNGPQVGLLALQNAAYKEISPYPLDILGAQTQGMIGYMFCQSINAAMPEKKVVTLLSRVQVDQDDPAFADPTKFIGPIYSKEEADALAEEKGGIFKQDGEAWRRVVPSPVPRRFLEKDAIEKLISEGMFVIASGGGGIPVIASESEGYLGVEAVVDKDLSAQLLAQQIGADFLLILTDTDAVYENWGTPEQSKIGNITADEIRKHDFPAGSMGPKIDAACSFVEQTGKRAAIGSLTQAEDIVKGTAGTQIMP
ncbi:MAG: carbamate kinase [Desulfobacter sp.]